jgi:hypothetical protein
MLPPSPRDPLAAAGSLLVGPGSRGQDLALVLRALAEPRGVFVRAFDDVAEIASLSESSGVVLLDVDAVPVEDLGYVRRFLATRADVEIVLLGSDPRVRSARYLGAQRFTAWPPDVEELQALVNAAAGHGGSTPGASVAPVFAATVVPTSVPPPRARSSAAAAPAARASAAATLESDELDQVRAILEQASTTEDFAPPADWPAGGAASAPATSPRTETPRGEAIRRTAEPAREEPAPRLETESD